MSTADQGRRLRVVQWATGTVGAFALRAIIDHPDLELVGVRVYSEEKDGADAGELCGHPSTGVKATRDIEAILALEPDCVVYMPDRTEPEEVCRLLKAGINIVTTRPEFLNPSAGPEGLRARVEAACRSGHASVHATGSSPGFITEALPITLLSLLRRLDFFSIDEYANCREGCSEEMLTQVMGFGDTPEAFAKRHCADHAAFEYSLGLLADAVGLPITSFERTVEAEVCRRPTELHKSTIPAGSVGAQRVAVTGLHRGKPLMRFRSHWFVTKDVEPAWELRDDGWRVSVEGDTPIDMTISLPMPVEETMRASARYTAHRPINAIRSVCAARPGIVPTTELPQVIARLG